MFPIVINPGGAPPPPLDKYRELDAERLELDRLKLNFEARSLAKKELIHVKENCKLFHIIDLKLRVQ